MAQDLGRVHQGEPILTRGAALGTAKFGMIMIHGRGDQAAGILGLARELPASDFVYAAPQAHDNTWYPYPFMQPIRRNQPYLDSALRAVGAVFALLNQNGIPNERILLLGFSQGACLSLEYAVRMGGRFGGVAGLSGGLIGEPGTRWDTPTQLHETPIFLGCDVRDPHIPEARVHELADVLTAHGAVVTKRLYQGMGHTISEDELIAVRAMMSALRG